MTTTESEQAADDLEHALGALGIELVDTHELPVAVRAGAAAGLLIIETLNRVIDAAAAGDEVDMRVHRTLIDALDHGADTMRADHWYTLLNILQLWLIQPPMLAAVGDEAVDGASDHLEAAKRHLERSGALHLAPDDTDTAPDDADPDPDDDAPQFIGPFLEGDPEGMPDPALMAEFRPPAADPVTRMSRASMALGLLPGVQVRDGDPEDMHYGHTIATIAGALAARSTLEMTNAIAVMPEAGRGSVAELWCRGFSMGLITTPAPEVSDYLIGGTMMHIVSLVGAWYANAPDSASPRAQAVAELLTAATNAGRADALAAAPVDQRAEYIARNGIDDGDSHRSAVALAESALAALKTLDTM